MNTPSGSSPNEINIDAIVITLVVLMSLLILIPIYKQNRREIDTKIKRVINRQAHVVVVSTYGPTVEGSPFYEAYIAKAMKFILDPTNKVNEVVIVGGYTVDKDTSQSKVVLNYIKQTYPEFNTAGIAVSLDECGITTWMNIKNAKTVMEKNNIKAKKITIFAESSREKKIAFFANNVFNKESAIDKNTILNEINPLITASQDAQLVAFSLKTSQWSKLSQVDNTYLPNREIRIISEPSGLPQQFIDEEYAKIFQEITEFYDATFASKTIRAKLDEWSKTAGFNVAENLVEKGCVEYKDYLNK